MQALSESREKISVERSNCLALQKANENLRLQLREQDRLIESLRQLCNHGASQHRQSLSPPEALLGEERPCLGCAEGMPSSKHYRSIIFNAISCCYWGRVLPDAVQHRSHLKQPG